MKKLFGVRWLDSAFLRRGMTGLSTFRTYAFVFQAATRHAELRESGVKPPHSKTSVISTQKVEFQWPHTIRNYRRNSSGRVPLLLAVVMVAFCIALSSDVLAAVGCTLSNPAQDLKFLFPEMTTYKEEIRQLDQMKNGKELFSELKERLGSDLDPVYETFETPYTLYTVFNGERIIGYVHGVNVPGEGGVIQIFMSVDPGTGAILRMFFQRIESFAAKALKKKDFLSQFNGLTLADFYKHDYFAVVEPASTNDRITQIKSPIPEGQAGADYAAALRGVRKDLILIDIFVFDRKNEPFYRKAQEELERGKNSKSELRNTKQIRNSNVAN